MKTKRERETEYALKQELMSKCYNTKRINPYGLEMIENEEEMGRNPSSHQMTKMRAKRVSYPRESVISK